MAIARFAWGIDIGNRALKAIKLVRNAEGLRVDDFEVIEHEQVLSNAGDNRESLIQQSLANFVQRHPMKGGIAAIGVSGQQSFARFIKLPPVEPKKIPEIVRFEAIQQIPFPLDDVEWTYQLFQSPESPDVEVGIFAMRKELVNQHIGYFTDVDINVQVVQTNPLAVYNAMLYDGRLRDTTMIIDMGGENTDLIIADKDSVWLRSISIGGNNFTEALVKAFKLNFAKAEELKRNSATSKYARQIFQAMRPIFADLVAEIQRSIGFYASVHRDSRIKRIMALGGTFRLPGLQKYLQQNLSLDVERIDRFAGGSPPDAKLAGTFNENLLSLVTAYGLAVQAMGEGAISSSLLPAHIRRAKLWQDKTKWFAGAAALIVVGTGIGYGASYFSQWQFEQAKPLRDRIGTIMTQATRLDREWSDIESSGAPDRQQIAAIKSLEKYRALWPRLLSDITHALPRPQVAVASGDPAKIKSIPRTDRQQVILNAIGTRYVAEMTTVLADTDFKKYAAGGALPTAAPSPGVWGGADPYRGGMDPSEEMYNYDQSSSGAPVPVAATPASKRGFLLTLHLTTPNAGGYGFIDKTVIKELRALSEDSPELEKKRYYIAKVEIVSANRIRENPARMSTIKAGYDAAAVLQKELSPAPAGPGAGEPAGMAPPERFDPFGNAAAPAGAAPVENPYVDRVTDEDLREDWEVRVLVAVVIDAAPKTVEAVASGQ